MTDWQEAGRKADAHRIRNLYRAMFDDDRKDVVRWMAVEAFKKVGGRRCLDLWGGGLSAVELLNAGLDVISVDNGTMQLTDRGNRVSAMRKRRALEVTAEEDGYSARWGPVAKYAQEADVAFLDFCGPWSRDVRRAIEACRHMKAIVVTLMTDHEMVTGATTQAERRMAYEAFLRLATQLGSRHKGASGEPFAVVRRLCEYRRANGQPVWVYLLTRERVALGPMSQTIRRKLDPVYREKLNTQSRERQREYRRDPERAAYLLEYNRQRRHAATASPRKSAIRLASRS